MTCETNIIVLFCAQRKYKLPLLAHLYLCAMSIIGTDIILAKKALEAAQLVGIPTETVYGLAANALNEQAVLSVFSAKNRPFFDPLIVHIAGIEQLGLYTEAVDPRLLRLAESFWPGPLTLLLPKKEIVPGIVTSGLPRVAIRVPNHPLSLALLKNLSFPLAAPSANPFGYVSPTTAQHVQAQMGDKVAYILDGGACEVGLESTIVGLEENKLCVYRLGGLSIEAIEQVAGKVEMALNVSSDPRAPGQLKNHYAPRKPLYLGDVTRLAKEHAGKKIALIEFGKHSYSFHIQARFQLSETENLQEAALNLFSALRLADESDADIVLVSPVAEQDLGRAINDRLRRASVR